MLERVCWISSFVTGLSKESWEELSRQGPDRITLSLMGTILLGAAKEDFIESDKLMPQLST